MAEYARHHDLDADEGYRWKRILRRVQRWPTAVEKSAAGSSAVVARQAVAQFARVRVASRAQREASLPLRLALLLANGRQAEVIIEDERQLPRVLALLEQPG